MNPILLRSLALLCLAGAVQGCRGTTEPLIDGEFAAVTVFGRVLGPDGAPVALAEVDVEHRRASACSQPYSAGNSVTTGADGRFRATVGQWGTRHEVCLVVNAVPRESSGLAPNSVVRTPVLMLSPPGDSLEIDIHLQAK